MESLFTKGVSALMFPASGPDEIAVSMILNSTDSVICHCSHVTRSQIRDVLTSGKARHDYDVTDTTHAGECCNGCRGEIKQIVKSCKSCRSGLSWRSRFVHMLTDLFGRDDG